MFPHALPELAQAASSLSDIERTTGMTIFLVGWMSLLDCTPIWIFWRLYGRD